MKVFADNLKSLRESRGLSIIDTAQKLGLSVQRLRRLENNCFRRLKFEKLVEIANFYDVTTDYLLGRHSNSFL